MKNPISTFVLISLNILVFGWLAIQQRSLLMDRNLDILAIIQAGANLNPLTLGGESWRMVSSMFLHFGILHLAVNMFSLYSLGSSLEPKVGSVRFLFVYFLCGIGANIASLLFNVYVPSAGASGAIFGLYGYLLGVEIIGNFKDRQRLGSIAINFIIFVIINAFISSQVSVDMAGHIGGGLSGIVLAFLLHKFVALNDFKSLIVMLILLFSTIFVLPLGQVKYYRFFQHLIKTDTDVNTIYRNSKSDQELSNSLQSSILPKWDSLKNELETLTRIPKAVVRDTIILHDYIAFRKQEATYRMKLVEQESYIYLDSIEEVDHQLDSLPRLKFILNYLPSKLDNIEPDTTHHDENPTAQLTKVFYDGNWNEIENEWSAEYYRIGQRDSIGNWQGVARDYFKNGDVQMKGKYIDGLKNGVFIYYSDRRTYESAGRYEKELRVGKWEQFHWNGKIQSEIFYAKNAYIKSVWDSLGNQQVANGNGKIITWFANGKILEEGSLKNGMRQDFWHGFYSDGKPHYEEFYQNNELIKGISSSKRGERYTYDQSSNYPFPVGGINSFKEYLKKNNKAPSLGVKERGLVKVVFDVDEEGKLSNITILKGLCQQCDQEALRLIKEGPAWRPSLVHGHIKIKSQGYAEILF